MREEQVTRTILQWLENMGWCILDYDFPGGGTGREFHLSENSSEKNKGIVIPDIIATRDGSLVLFEDKAEDTLSDYQKIRQLSSNPEFSELLRKAYPEKKIDNIIWGIGYSGTPKHLNQASSYHIDIIVQVVDVGQGKHDCSIVYGRNL